MQFVDIFSTYVIDKEIEHCKKKVFYLIQI